MATKQRPADAGTERGRALLAELTREARTARRDRGLSLAEVGRAVGLSQAAMSRFEDAETAGYGIVRLSKSLAAVRSSWRQALASLAAGADPDGSSVIVMPRKLGP